MAHIEPCEPTLVLDGLAFPECPRWHEGALWFSDMADGRILRLDADGEAQTMAEGPPGLAGLGWTPEGRMLVVAGTQRQLLECARGASHRVRADMSSLASHPCNDMVIDTQGRAYIGQFGFDFVAGETPRAASLLRVDADGTVHEAASELMYANGMVITPDGGTLIVAETYARRLSAFTMASDGSLGERRVWATLERAEPDGICLDADGALWVATTRAEVRRVREGGEVTDRIALPEQAFACMLGGEDRRTLYMLSSHLYDRDGSTFRYNDWQALRHLRRGRIDTIRVAVPGVGRP